MFRENHTHVTEQEKQIKKSIWDGWDSLLNCAELYSQVYCFAIKLVGVLHRGKTRKEQSAGAIKAQGLHGIL